MTATEAKAKEILSRKQVSKLLDLSTRTIARMTQKGALKSYVIDEKHYYKYSEIIRDMGMQGEKKAA